MTVRILNSSNGGMHKGAHHQALIHRRGQMGFSRERQQKRMNIAPHADRTAGQTEYGPPKIYLGARNVLAKEDPFSFALIFPNTRRVSPSRFPGGGGGRSLGKGVVQ